MNRELSRKEMIVTLAVGACLALALFVGCSGQKRAKVLDFFFDREGAPPPKRRVRRDLLREIEELKRQLEKERAAAKAQGEKAVSKEAELPIERAKGWPEVAQLLPKESKGHVDWDQAFKAGTIKPRPGPDPKSPEQAVLELDVELASSSKFFSITFSHGGHTRWLACGSCHPAIFPLKRQAKPTMVTMAKIEVGQQCGACHGTVAFGMKDRCVRCHPKIPATEEWRPAEESQNPLERARTWADAAKLLPVTDGMPDLTKALADGVIGPRPGIDPKAAEEEVLELDIERTPEGDEESKVIFPHEAHTAWLACANCHPALFQEETGATPMSMEKIEEGQSCGACHGKGVTFPVDACGRCHPAMKGGK